MDAAKLDTYRIMAESMYAAINQQYWMGNLPDIPIRVSNRMKVAAGGFRYRLATSKRRANITVNGQTSTLRGISYHGEIALSGPYLEKGFTTEILVDTMKHEVAHLVEFTTRGVVGHGREFKKHCVHMECSPARYHNIGTEADDGEFVYFCPVCYDITRYVRLAKGTNGELCNCSGSYAKKQFAGRARELKKVLTALTAELFAEDFVRIAAKTASAVKTDELRDWPSGKPFRASRHT